ncbi:3-isopropylmalate dehydrogenase [Usitatibacter palustris]|uniref:3-isopropylmalate dehydrogenase n=1 Tax=Usitatibacter palustris TaxID=2732487 RepID=A0A6M4H7K2_9PROT|nr:3-isopropylmalate dehydrogenase [Usitatibacter palustris]QJR14673.1 3-isopropylmalate dehydrogenase [Usitatibacter palustris]
MKIALLAGDGIGNEIMREALRVLDVLRSEGLKIETQEALVGGAAYDAHGDPLPDATLKLVQQSDAILFGAIGGPQYDKLPRDKRPEKAILGLRKECDFFANLRPANVFPELADASTLKPEVVSGLDIMIVRELVGDIYFGQPRGITGAAPNREGFNTMRYTEAQIRRILHVGFKTAMARGKRLCSIDKMNVLETTQLWRDIAEEIAPEYPEVQLSHMLVDNCAMQLVRNPRQFDVIVTGNMFGDILSDEASMLTGSIGMLPSASLDANGKGLYEPIHGSAPDIAGKGVANPLAMILSMAMMFRYTFNRTDLAARIESAVRAALATGLRTADIATKTTKPCTTAEMGTAVVKAL